MRNGENYSASGNENYIGLKYVNMLQKVIWSSPLEIDKRND